MKIIEVNGLTKTYGDLTAVDHISFTVEQGTMLGFLGINGAGKSTAINMLSTLLRPDGGSATVCGHQIGQEDEQIRRKIGIVYQQNVLDDLLSVRENLLCRGILHGANRRQAAAQLDRLCQILKLEDILKKQYKTLSGGQKRRCEIAAALMHTPQVLFLDEPTTGLDPATRKDVWEIIETLRRDEQMTVFLTTHYMEEAADAAYIVILDSGKISAEGTPLELKNAYTGDYITLYRAREAVVKNLGVPYEAIRDALRPSIPNTAKATELIINNPEIFTDYEITKGKMDDVFLNVTGKKLDGGAEKRKQPWRL